MRPKRGLTFSFSSCHDFLLSLSRLPSRLLTSSCSNWLLCYRFGKERETKHKNFVLLRSEPSISKSSKVRCIEGDSEKLFL